MRAVILEKIGAPLTTADIELPKTLGPGQVLVKVLCTGICGSQLQEIDGKKGDPVYLPHLLGHEGCGIVESTGEGVMTVAKGDKVVMHWRKGDGLDVAGGIFFDNTIIAPGIKIFSNPIKSGPITTFSEYSIVSENRVTKIPDDVPNDLAALLGCALSTALAVMENEARPKSCDLVFIRGCGGVGLCMIFAAKIYSARVVGIDISQLKEELIEGMGASFYFPNSGFFTLGGILIDTIANEKPEHFSGKYISLQKGGTEGGGFEPAKDIPRYVQMWRDGKLDGYEKIITHRLPLDRINEGIQLMRDGKAGRVMIEM